MSGDVSAAAAAAAQRRFAEVPSQTSPAQELAEHEKRQAFRRMIDPGIVRPNPKEQAIASLKTLLTLAQNLLREPDNPKYQQFKPTNDIIKRDLVDPKGTLEYAVKLGFSPEVKDFQPYYTFNRKHMDELRIGGAILREYLDLEAAKAKRASHSKVDQKAMQEAITRQVKLAFMDDRKTKMRNDEIERERREARRSSPNRAETTVTRYSQSPPPGNSAGHRLGGDLDDIEGPPPYE